MKQINLSGIVGYDFTSRSVKRDLAEAKGDVEITLNSAGGYVYDGIAIYNAIKKHNKEVGKVKITVDGIAMSMASIIMFAGSELEFEDNSVVMIHNPWGYSVGDYRQAEKSSKQLKMLRDIMAKIYLEKGNYKTIDEVNSVMDEETYYSMDELKKFGSVKTGDKKEDVSALKVVAMNELEKVKTFIKAEAEKIDDESAAAILSSFKPSESLANKEVVSSQPFVNITNEGKNKMSEITLDIVMQHPEIVKAISDQAIKKERERVAAHMEFMDTSPKAVIEAVSSGAEFTVAHMSKYGKEMGFSNALKELGQGNIEPISQKEQIEVADDNASEEAKINDEITQAFQKSGLGG